MKKEVDNDKYVQKGVNFKLDEDVHKMVREVAIAKSTTNSGAILLLLEAYHGKDISI